MEIVAWLNAKYRTLHHASEVTDCADVTELVPLVRESDAAAMRAALIVTRGNIESLAAAQCCTTYKEWARVIDEALSRTDDADARNQAGYAA